MCFCPTFHYLEVIDVVQPVRLASPLPNKEHRPSGNSFLGQVLPLHKEMRNGFGAASLIGPSHGLFVVVRNGLTMHMTAGWVTLWSSRLTTKGRGKCRFCWLVYWQASNITRENQHTERLYPLWCERDSELNWGGCVLWPSCSSLQACWHDVTLSDFSDTMLPSHVYNLLAYWTTCIRLYILEAWVKIWEYWICSFHISTNWALDKSKWNSSGKKNLFFDNVLEIFVLQGFLIFSIKSFWGLIQYYHVFGRLVDICPISGAGKKLRSDHDGGFWRIWGFW